MNIPESVAAAVTAPTPAADVAPEVKAEPKAKVKVKAKAEPKANGESLASLLGDAAPKGNGKTRHYVVIPDGPAWDAWTAYWGTDSPSKVYKLLALSMKFNADGLKSAIREGVRKATASAK